MKTEVGDEDSLWNYGGDQCEKVFWSGNFLDLHIWIEENVLIIFKCDICEMAADFGSGLNNHIKAKHVGFYGIFVSWWRLRIM